MEFWFADDSRQNEPSRPGMGPLIAIGGFHVNGEKVYELEKNIDQLCKEYGFPDNEEFKWSPKKGSWMYHNLKGEDRKIFFLEVLSLIEKIGSKAVVVIEDTKYRTANKNSPSHEIDVTNLFLERANTELVEIKSYGIVITDRPSGGRKDENKFLANCYETLKQGTEFVKFHKITRVLTSPSKFDRLLQVADLITSCTLAYVGGENKYSPPIFAKIKNILCKKGTITGGIGLKIHPDCIYANLYYWLLGDKTFRKKDRYRKGVNRILCFSREILKYMNKHINSRNNSIIDEFPSRRYPYYSNPMKLCYLAIISPHVGTSFSAQDIKFQHEWLQ